ncbi:coproporphyrinogen-III oxidase [Mesorhizobium tianshanense]|uniref:Coproporphyrinogen-III oxidase n=1 Tax=Mesorhizobium tianshanense TaxID=39844 RepID=A0A562N7Y3_9HYPH|nr:oxygen-independent coproporphyrinogen III oxidase [Mesorhizobium tianshanense]TWI28289.1 oxygen-independent coproporphyrinogen-3 oxidase [Mesorhizobium tianshanense]GLS38875.1 coproporphyrinogen-III oxidase [Mesorhizobium tianshanense]
MQVTILRKYGEARLPRYTSYPTAPRFSQAVGADIYEGWLSDLPSGDPVSLYLHIPFCRSMCWYCGCHTTISRKDQPILDYLDALREEIRIVADRAPKGLQVGEVHFGGGTPTIIEPAEFASLMELLRQRFEFTAAASIAIEIDPRTLTADMAEALGAAGIGRASLGVQSFDPVVQKAVNRIQSEEQTAEAVDNLRRHGVARINFDLIYGLPHQTAQSCVDTATAAVAMKPDRLAVFGYAHVPTFKKHQRMIDEAALPDSAARSEQASAIAETLVAAGYRQIGLDHFALPDDDLVRAQQTGTLRRNFQGYTTDNCNTLLGFGASAIGRTQEGYIQNEVAPGLYARHVAAGRLATSKGYRLTAEDLVRAAIIERLMCDFEADVAAICASHGFEPARILETGGRLEELMQDGVLDMTDGFIRVRQDHRFVIRAVAAAFDAYLDQSVRAHSKAA